MIIMHNEVNRLLAYLTKHLTQSARGNAAETNDLELSKIHTLCDCEWWTVWDGKEEELELRETTQGCRNPDRHANPKYERVETIATRTRSVRIWQKEAVVAYFRATPLLWHPPRDSEWHHGNPQAAQPLTVIEIRTKYLQDKSVLTNIMQFLRHVNLKKLKVRIYSGFARLSFW